MMNCKNCIYYINKDNFNGVQNEIIEKRGLNDVLGFCRFECQGTWLFDQDYVCGQFIEQKTFKTYIEKIKAEQPK